MQREKIKHRYKKGEGDKPELKKKGRKKLKKKKVANFSNAEHFNNLVGEASRSEYC